jgi:ligand-binding sensor domain-containing protein
MTTLPSTIINLQLVTLLELGANSISPKNISPEVKAWADTYDPDWLINQNLPFFACTTFSTTNGLPNNNIHAIAFDSSGNWWFGTESSGVCIFNGTLWKIVDTATGLVNNVIRDIMTDKNNIVWIATAGGVSAFDGTTWKKYDATNGLAGNDVRSLAMDRDGNMWFGCAGVNGGVSMFDSKKWTTYKKSDGLLSNNVQCIAIDQNKKPWVGSQGGLCFLSANTWQPCTTMNGSAIDMVWGIAIDNNNTPWAALSYGAGGATGAYLNNQLVLKFNPWNYPLSIDIDCFNRVWVGTSFEGVYMYDGIRPHVINRYNGLVYNITNCVVADNKNKAVWVGTDCGVTRIQLFDPFTPVVIPENSASNKKLSSGLMLSRTADKGVVYFTIAVTQRIEIALFDSKGRCVQTLFDGQMAKGTHSLPFTTAALGSGVYLCRLKKQDNTIRSIRYIAP